MGKKFNQDIKIDIPLHSTNSILPAPGFPTVLGWQGNWNLCQKHLAMLSSSVNKRRKKIMIYHQHIENPIQFLQKYSFNILNYLCWIFWIIQLTRVLRLVSTESSASPPLIVNVGSCIPHTPRRRSSCSCNTLPNLATSTLLLVVLQNIAIRCSM